MIPRDYQEAAIASIFKYFANGGNGNPIVLMPTGCHAIGAEILMFNGAIKQVEDIVVGDLVMGPDSLPRRVLSLAQGQQEMRRIIPTIGEAFEVNIDHKLSVYCTKQGNNSSHCRNAKIETITIRQYENGTNCYRHLRKLRRVSVNFNKQLLKLDSYFLGLMLGDGSMCNGGFSFTTADIELADYFCEYVLTFNCTPRIEKINNSKALQCFAPYSLANRSIENPLTKIFRELKLQEKRAWDKHIPFDYKTSDYTDRIKLLAGLIDSDGYIYGASCEYATVSCQLAKDVQFLARSLGFACSLKKQKSSYTVKRVKHLARDVYVLHINGDLTTIPLKRIFHINRLKKRTINKNCLVTGFKIKKLPIANYYGFELDGDHLYCDANFIVHHNTGKSIVIGEFIKRLLTQWPHSKCMMLTHVKELIDQNRDKLLKVWPLAPVGIYSAGLGKKEAFYPVTFGGVSSVAKAKNFSAFGKIDLLLIDECHLVSPNDATQYNKIIKALKRINPELKVIGFTATDFRVGHGKLTQNDHLFTDVCIDMTSLEGFNWFIEQGYLVPLIPKRPKLQIDISSVHMRGGEYIENEAQAAMDKHEITRAAIDEMLEYGVQRKRWLIFAQGVNHAEHVHEMLISRGVNATVVHSKLSKEQRDDAINGFKIGYYDVIVNNGILTTGFDCPEVDLIGVLRLTQSPGLWVQILGRGTRPCYAEGYDLSTKEGRLASIHNSRKLNCLVLDFAGNTKRLGPINNPVIPKFKGSGGGGLAPVKVCEVCMCYNHASVRYCKECGTEFIASVKIQKYAGTENLIAENEVKELDSTIFSVDKVTYKLYKGRNSLTNSLKVTYYCGLRNFVEYICLEHKGYPLIKARNWWRDASLEPQKPCPITIESAIEKLDTLKQAKRIRVLVKETNSEIINYEY